jgi:SAM-dependent methyltransferase
MAATYKDIPIAGGNTARPRALVRRLSVIQSHLDLKAGIRFLDCGCGAGEYVRALVEQLELEAYGVEYDQQVVDKIPADDMLKPRVFQGDLQAINYPAGEWDYAMLNELLEHVADDGKVMDEIHRILKSNGVLFIFSPNRWFPFETHGVFLKNATKRTLWIPFIPYVPVNWGKRFYSSWARNYWQGELRRLVTSHGFTIVATDFIWPTFENVSNSQPTFIRIFRGFFRTASRILERTPFLRRFGVSQVLVCRKASSPGPI